MPPPGNRPAPSGADRASSSLQEQAVSVSPSPDTRDSGSETDSAPPQASASPLPAAGGAPPPAPTEGGAPPSQPPGALSEDFSPPEISESACYSVADSSSIERVRCSQKRAAREQQATPAGRLAGEVREQRVASAMIPPTPTDRELRSAAPLGSGPSAVAPSAAADPVETPEDPEDPLLEGISQSRRVSATGDCRSARDRHASSVSRLTYLSRDHDPVFRDRVDVRVPVFRGGRR